MFIVNGDLKDGLLIDGGPVPEGTDYTPIPGTDFVGGFFEVRIQRPFDIDKCLYGMLRV